MRRTDLVYYAGKWRTPEGIVRKRRGNRERQRRYEGSPAGVLARTRRTAKRKEDHLGS